MANRPSKRQRTSALLAFGAPAESDASPISQPSIPSSSASSTRNLPIYSVPALTSLCLRVFVNSFIKLRTNESVWKTTSEYLKVLPEFLTPRLFALLRQAYPTYLEHQFIVTYLLRGPSVTFTSELPGVTRATILAIPRINPRLQTLELSGFDKYSDSFFAETLRHLRDLRSVTLRGCTKVGAETVRTIGASCSELRSINANYTSAPPAAFVPILVGCLKLEVLKCAGIQSWTDATFSSAIATLNTDLKFDALRTIKLRQTPISDTGLNLILPLCPNLRRLDVSFTRARHPTALLSPRTDLRIMKLSLTSTAFSINDILSVLSHLPELQILALGDMGVNRGSRLSITNSSAMTLDDESLQALTKVLVDRRLDSVNLVGNVKLGTSSKFNNPLEDFIVQVGRKCRKLNLAGIPSLKSHHLFGLVPNDALDEVSPLDTLILNNTSIDDDAGTFIASCPNLRTLSVAGTKISSDGLFTILDACNKLENLDLTSCRGIKVVDRRRFFEVWEQSKH